MLRPNLYCLLTALVTLTFCPGRLHAQHGPPGGMFQHQPIMQMPHSGYQAPIVDHYIQSAPSVWDDNQPIEKFLTEVSQRSWLKVEYLHWDIESPGAGTIGSAVSGLRTTDQQFEAFDNLNGGISLGTGELMNNQELDLTNTSGIRGTWGLDLNGGSMELNFFGTEESSDTWSVPNIRNFRPVNAALGNTFSPNLVLPLLTNGGVNDTATMNSIIFDDSVQTRFNSQLWGAEAAFLTDPYLPGEGFKWQWLGGFRYLSLDETYSFTGSYDNGGTTTDEMTNLTSSTVNNIYGPEIGGRASLVHRWFKLSVTPRVTFGINDYAAQVAFNMDPRGTLVNGANSAGKDDEIDFCTITQLSFMGEVNINPNFALYGGYDFMWLPRVSRPDGNVYYNSTPAIGGGFDPQIGLAKELENFVVQGLSIGAVFRY